MDNYSSTILLARSIAVPCSSPRAVPYRRSAVCCARQLPRQFGGVEQDVFWA